LRWPPEPRQQVHLERLQPADCVERLDFSAAVFEREKIDLTDRFRNDDREPAKGSRTPDFHLEIITASFSTQ
jgi:hypothetical protein